MKLADKIVMRPIAALAPYASNARTHTPEQIALIAKSIQEFGWTNPILVDGENGIIAGHARWEGAKTLGLTEVPTIELSWLTPEQRQAYIIADNQTAIAGAGWNPELLRLELGSLKELGFDLSPIGFSDIELGSLFGEESSAGAGSGAGSLAAQFGVPPFSVLNAREGWWQDRKRAWLALGIRSELGRGELANDRDESSSARINDAADGQRRYANAAPGGSAMPAAALENGKI